MKDHVSYDSETGHWTKAGQEYWPNKATSRADSYLEAFTELFGGPFVIPAPVRSPRHASVFETA